MTGILIERLMKAAIYGGSGWVMWLLIVLSVFSIAATVERLIFFRKNSGDVDALSDRVAALLEAGDQDGAEKLLANSPAIEASVILGALHWIKGGAESFHDAVDSQMTKKKKELDRGMYYLGTLGSNAPFIGLFGTVIGVLVAFHQLSEGTDKGSMNNVMAGIAEALITTGVGLFVAIPAVVAYNWFQKKVGDVESNVGMMEKQISAWLRAQHGPPNNDPHPRRNASKNGDSRARNMSPIVGEAQ